MDGLDLHALSSGHPYAYALIALMLFLETVFFLGFVVPGLSVLIVAGFLVSTRALDLGPAWLCALAGTTAGDNLSFLLGRLGSMRLARIGSLRRKMTAAARVLRSQPPWLLVFFHFPVYLRTVVPLALGSVGYAWPRWLALDTIGATLFTGCFLGIGMVAGHVSREVDAALAFGGSIVVFASLMVVVWIVMLATRLRRRRNAN
jgi:membrane-associated protein